ncbi:MAG TPA: hypothetical protein VJN02_03220 [Gammaproteobacteria bacterium]|nr:hypothetical protein [Gammaproteobacteria bacterium]
MKPKCNNCRGLYQEKNEILDKGGVCAICKPEVDYREQIAMIEEGLDCYWEEKESPLYGKRQ